MAKVERVRLDELLVARGMAPTRSAARGMILAGLVEIDGQVNDKPGAQLLRDVGISVKERPRYVSRGGDKLASALATLRVEVRGRSALDVGASTGGFTDCLLQHGATRVIALDVGRGQLDQRLRTDPRVRVLERVNARYLEPGILPYQPDFLTMDVSFISVSKVLPSVVRCMAPEFEGLVLVKPQFEAGPRQVGKGGVVRDPEVHRQVLLSTVQCVAQTCDVVVLGACRSPIRGADGNVEFFVHLARGREDGLALDRLEEVVNAVVFGGASEHSEAEQ